MWLISRRSCYNCCNIGVIIQLLSTFHCYQYTQAYTTDIPSCTDEGWCSCLEEVEGVCSNGTQEGPFWQDCEMATQVNIYNDSGLWHEYIRCCASNYTTIHWYENTTASNFTKIPLVEEENMRYLIDGNQSLYVQNSRSFGGHYYCVVENVQTGLTLNLRVALVFVVNPTCHTVPELLEPTATTYKHLLGDRFVVSCVATFALCKDFDGKAVFWLDGSNQMIDEYSSVENTSNVFVIDTTRNDTQGLAILNKTLTIKTIAEENLGHYTCIAMNVYGDTTVSITLEYGSDVKVITILIGSAVAAATGITVIVIILGLVLSYRHGLVLSIRIQTAKRRLRRSAPDWQSNVLVISSSDEDVVCFRNHFTQTLQNLFENQNPLCSGVNHECHHISVHDIDVVPGCSVGNALESAAQECNHVIYIITTDDLNNYHQQEINTRFFATDIHERFIGSIFVLFKWKSEDLTDTARQCALYNAIQNNQLTFPWPDSSRTLRHLNDCDGNLCTFSRQQSRKQKKLWKMLQLQLMSGNVREVVHTQGNGGGGIQDDRMASNTSTTPLLSTQSSTGEDVASCATHNVLVKIPEENITQNTDDDVFDA